MVRRAPSLFLAAANAGIVTAVGAAQVPTASTRAFA
jgi:hypothetical protein